MLTFATAWIYATIAASASQTARNFLQRQLTGVIGTLGATQVRFVYGFPFALVFLAAFAAMTGEPVPGLNAKSGSFLLIAALGQIAATAFMLSAMRSSGFAVTIALTKTEPVLVALFGLVILGDPLTLGGTIGILAATGGVILISHSGNKTLNASSFGPAMLGIASAAFFAVSATSFRGAIISLPDGSFLMRATTILVWGLGTQSLLLGCYLLVFDRTALVGSLRIWQRSLSAGFFGALASLFWFIALSLTTAANVRTLGLIEILFAQALSRHMIAELTTRRQMLGVGLVVIGVGMLLYFQATLV